MGLDGVVVTGTVGAPLGRFSGADRHLVEEDMVEFTSVGVDIGSSTSHLVFSRLKLERQGTRYVVVERHVLAQSEILLTPYVDQTTIDGEALARFVERQYERAGIARGEVDTGALILTGVALLRDNARAIAELFASEAGRFVAVSAGDNLEALLAAHGSGALRASAVAHNTVLNVDIGGGTSKLAVCHRGEAVSLAAIDVGARLVVLDDEGRITRLEEAGRRMGSAIGLDLYLGRDTSADELRALARHMADRLERVIRLEPLTDAETSLLRTAPLQWSGRIDAISFSGGVSEFVYGRESSRFGDLGALLAEEMCHRVEASGLELLRLPVGIRATVVGASQYTVQVSGSTIFISPADAVPVRSVPVVVPPLDLTADTLDADAVAASIQRDLRHLDLAHGETPVALAVPWEGSATYGRIDALCRGIARGLECVLRQGHPLLLVFEGDVGGLFGLHLKETLGLPNPVISVDGIAVEQFNYVDVGAIIPSSGAVPVVVKSLVFPARTTVSERTESWVTGHGSQVTGPERREGTAD